MAYIAKKDGIINENEIGTYIRFPNNAQMRELAQEYTNEFETEQNGAVAFYGNVEDFEKFLEQTGNKFYNKIIDGSKAHRIHIKHTQVQSEIDISFFS